MATGYERNMDSYLRRIANALEGIEKALGYLVEQVQEEREVREQSDEQECGTDD